MTLVVVVSPSRVVIHWPGIIVVVVISRLIPVSLIIIPWFIIPVSAVVLAPARVIIWVVPIWIATSGVVVEISAIGISIPVVVCVIVIWPVAIIVELVVVSTIIIIAHFAVVTILIVSVGVVVESTILLIISIAQVITIFCGLLSFNNAA